MLTLTRKNGQSVKIADNVAVTVYTLLNADIKFAFDAPKSIESCMTVQ